MSNSMKASLAQRTTTAVRCESPRLAPLRARPSRQVLRAPQAAQVSTTVLRERVDQVVADVLAGVPSSRRASIQEIGADRWQRLREAGTELGLDRVFLEYIPGGFVSEVTTDQRAFEGDVTNMARFTFAQFRPLDLKVELSHAVRDEGRRVTGLPDLFRGPYDGLERGYVLFTHFRIVEDKPSAEPPLLGVQAAIAEWGVPPTQPGAAAAKGPHGDQLTVSFRKMRLQPVLHHAAGGPGTDATLRRWLDLLLPHNPTMDPKTGVVEVALPPNGPVGTVTYMLMDRDVQAHVGNTGTHMILTRYTPPPGTQGAALVSQQQ